MSRAILPPNMPCNAVAVRPPAASSLLVQFDQFLGEASCRVETHPWLVVIAMHEVFRNLYPADPFIPFNAGESHADRISRVIERSTQWLNDAGIMPSYFAVPGVDPKQISPRSALVSARSAESNTQQLYGSLWDQFDTSVYIEEAVRILRERFAECGFLDSIETGSTVLDAGCGSGRYSMALASLCSAKVIGLDLGTTSLENARRIAADASITNLEFRTGNVLDLPFADGSIDCIFSNGVLHHTGDTARGLHEMHRVLRPGGRAFLYLYGAGGVFWHARRAARKVMQRIPREYTCDVLRMIGMPANRFIFVDTWYVPIEEHISRDALESLLSATGFSHCEKMVSRRATDLDSAEIMDDPAFAAIWGDGEHRYVLRKSA